MPSLNSCAMPLLLILGVVVIFMLMNGNVGGEQFTRVEQMTTFNNNEIDNNLDDYEQPSNFPTNDNPVLETPDWERAFESSGDSSIDAYKAAISANDHSLRGEPSATKHSKQLVTMRLQHRECPLVYPLSQGILPMPESPSMPDVSAAILAEKNNANKC